MRVRYEDLVLCHSQQHSAFHVTKNHWGVVLPCWYDSLFKQLSSDLVCVKNKEPGF